MARRLTVAYRWNKYPRRLLTKANGPATAARQVGHDGEFVVVDGDIRWHVIIRNGHVAVLYPEEDLT